MIDTPDEYWQEEIVGGLLDFGHDTQAELFWQLHSQEELYEEGPLEDLGLYLSRGLAILNYAAKGKRIYLHAAHKGKRVRRVIVVRRIARC